MKNAMRHALLCLLLISSQVRGEDLQFKLDEVPEKLRMSLMAINGYEGDPIPPLKDAVKVGEIRAKEIVLMGKRWPIGNCQITSGEKLIMLQLITSLGADGLYAVHLSFSVSNGIIAKTGTISIMWIQKGTPGEPVENEDNPAVFVILTPGKFRDQK